MRIGFLEWVQLRFLDFARNDGKWVIRVRVVFVRIGFNRDTLHALRLVGVTVLGYSSGVGGWGFYFFWIKFLSFVYIHISLHLTFENY